MLKLLPQIHDPQEWPGDLGAQHIERNQLPDAQVPADNQIGSRPEDRNGRDLLDKGRDLTGDGHETGRPEAGAT